MSREAAPPPRSGRRTDRQPRAVQVGLRRHPSPTTRVMTPRVVTQCGDTLGAMAARARPSDADVTALARRIAELGAGERSKVFRMSWWSERMLDWAMARPGFKTQLFRFVDVFPAL